jgi:hypothetical protein
VTVVSDRRCCDAERRAHAGLHVGAIVSADASRRSIACTVNAGAVNLGGERVPTLNTRVMSESDSDIISS